MTNPPQSLPVSVVIPTYNGRLLLAKHLPSVEQALKTGDELCIIDDAGTDDTTQWLTDRYDLQQQAQTDEYRTYAGTIASKQITVLYIRNTTNLRFAASCNRAIGLIVVLIFLLLNNDVELQADTIDVLRKRFSADTEQKIFGIGCFEYEDAAHTIISGKNKLWFERGLFIHSRADEFESGETAWVSGGSGMFRSAHWQQLSGFDEGFYPAYWEDIDVSFRARQRGWKVLFEKQAKVFHQHESTNADAFGSAIQQLSWQHADYFTRKHATPVQLIAYYLWRPYWWWCRKTL